MVRELGRWVNWKGCFGSSWRQQFSLLAGFPVLAHPYRHGKAGPVLAAWPAGAPHLHPMHVCPSYRKSWPNNWTPSRREPSRRCSLPSPESPCPRSRWARAFSDPAEPPPRGKDGCLSVLFLPRPLFFKLRIMTRGYKSLRRRPWVC